MGEASDELEVADVVDIVDVVVEEEPAASCDEDVASAFDVAYIRIKKWLDDYANALSNY